jgi:hypothetical protein
MTERKLPNAQHQLRREAPSAACCCCSFSPPLCTYRPPVGLMQGKCANSRRRRTE